jgi:hypothetical protein
MPRRYLGNDRHGKPKANYLHKLTKMTDGELSSEIVSVLYLHRIHGHLSNSDCHWQANACLDEVTTRGKLHLYTEAEKKVLANQSY